MKYFIAIVSLVAVTGCIPKPLEIPSTLEPTDTCIAGFVETSEGVGTLDLYTPSKYSEKLQSIPDVRTVIIPELELEPC